MSLLRLFKESCGCSHSKDEKDLYEETPPNMENWVQKNKSKFQDKYGDNWREVLYSTAWKIHNKNETSTTGGVAPTHYPVGYDDSEDKSKLKENNSWDAVFGEYTREIEKILNKENE